MLLLIDGTIGREADSQLKDGCTGKDGMRLSDKRREMLGTGVSGVSVSARPYIIPLEMTIGDERAEWDPPPSSEDNRTKEGYVARR